MSNGIDPETGERTHPISITIHRGDPRLTSFVKARNWAGAASYLTSDDFASIADGVESITISNLEA
jgi:hypothetical protein